MLTNSNFEHSHFRNAPIRTSNFHNNHFLNWLQMQTDHWIDTKLLMQQTKWYHSLSISSMHHQTWTEKNSRCRCAVHVVGATVARKTTTIPWTMPMNETTYFPCSSGHHRRLATTISQPIVRISIPLWSNTNISNNKINPPPMEQHKHQPFASCKTGE